MSRGADRNAEATGKLVGGITGRGWLPGHSGNPGGRRPLPEVLRERLDALVPEAVEAIAALARTAESESVRLAAWEYIMNRRFGRPTEKLEQVHGGVTAIMPTNEQMAALAREIMGDARAGGDNGRGDG